MATREDLRFNSGGDEVSAWLYRPDGTGADVTAPLLIMAHGLAGVRTMRLDAYAERFSAAGYACLVFDYRNFGDSGGAARQLLDIGMQLADWAAAFDYAHTLAGIDPARIGLWGTSLSGGHVIAAAAGLPGVAAVVAQCPFTDGVASARAFNPLTLPRVTALALRDLIGSRLGNPPVLIAAAGPPGAVALMTTPDAYPGYRRLLPDGAAIPDGVAARLALKILRYRPGRLAAKLRCPILFCVCRDDSVAPAGPTLRYAARAPRGEIKLYPQGHFAIYVDDPFERAVADQLAFLDRHLGSGDQRSAGCS